MDSSRFDQLTRSLGRSGNRRAFLAGVLGLGGAAAASAALRDSGVEAARRPTPTPKPVSCPGVQHWDGTKCVCPSGSDKCGPDCCPTGQAECCDNACCYGDCYGEELCCPTGQVVCNGTCCAAGEVCYGGQCLSCTPCGDSCCDGETPICCLGSNGTTCVASEESCCSSTTECQAVDSCTPALCLAGGTCNTVSNCVSGEQCCNGTCASTEDRCCALDGDCAGLDFCGESDAYHYTCVASVCTRSTEDCLGDDPCIEYFCANAACGQTRRPNCCSVDTDCQAVDSCTPARCLDNNTCSTVSSCGANEICCADGTCSQNGACNIGCTIDGVIFPPCVTGCPTCVAPNGGTFCGCGQVTERDAIRRVNARTSLGTGICAGPPGSSICVVPANPIG